MVAADKDYVPLFEDSSEEECGVRYVEYKGKLETIDDFISQTTASSSQPVSKD